MVLDTIARFESKFIPEPNSGCWLWMASLGEKGYGEFWFENQMRRAHRVAWALYRGTINDLHVLHHCDNRVCVNPDHLYLGTHVQNMAQRESRGMTIRGSRSPLAKLTEEDVAYIRRSTMTRRELMQIYNLSSGAIQHILQRRTWPHVP